MRALAVYLLAGQHLPLARTGGLLAELVGAPVSDGSLAGWYADAAAGLDGFDAALREGLAGAPVLGADETGIRVEGSLAWVHAARTDTPLKIRLKIAGCLRTMTGAEAFCRLRSYLSTARKQGQSAFAVLRTLHDGHPWMPATAGST